MGLTESERKSFVALLERRGWTLEDGTIWSPSRGLWFSDPHFKEMSLSDISEVFERRTQRIEKEEHEFVARNAKENRDAAEVAQELLKMPSTQHTGGG